MYQFPQGSIIIWHYNHTLIKMNKSPIFAFIELTGEIVWKCTIKEDYGSIRKLRLPVKKFPVWAHPRLELSKLTYNGNNHLKKMLLSVPCLFYISGFYLLYLEWNWQKNLGDKKCDVEKLWKPKKDRWQAKFVLIFHWEIVF